MTAVVANMARLTPEDRHAIAAYLKSLLAIHSEKRTPAKTAPTS